MIRISDPRQQGSRIAWSNSLFETVPYANAPAAVEPIPAGVAVDLPVPVLMPAEVWLAMLADGK